MEKRPLAFVTDQYLQYGSMIRGYKPPTIRTYRETFRLVEQMTNVQFIENLTFEVLEKMFITANSERNWSPMTFFTHHKNLKAFFNWAVVRGYVQNNPMTRIEKPRPRKALPKSLSVEDAERAIDAAYHLKWYIKAEGIRNRAIISTFIFAGLRRKELCNLKRNDIDLERRMIFVFDGKWGKDRIVPINSRLHYFLSEYARFRDKQYRDNIHFFVSLRDHNPLGASGIKRICYRISKASGVRVSPQILRHTFGTLTYRGSKDILAVSSNLGHSNVKTTQIYVQASVDDMKGVVEAHPMNR